MVSRMTLHEHFRRREFACNCGCGFDTVDAETLEVLASVRKHFRKPVYITSGARCAEHNRDVGGAPNSQHLYGRAADIKVDETDADTVQDWLEAEYPWLSVGRYLTFTHLDTRTNGPARWTG